MTQQEVFDKLTDLFPYGYINVGLALKRHSDGSLETDYEAYVALPEFESYYFISIKGFEECLAYFKDLPKKKD